MQGRTLCIFNPEHDLCLANGDRNFMPPVSALHFAEVSADIMRLVYGSEAQCTSADSFVPAMLEHASEVVLWGVDARTVNMLLKRGAPSSMLPSDAVVENVRRMQHRSFSLPLQTAVEQLSDNPQNVSLPAAVQSIEHLDSLVAGRRVVLKAPWSGSGRGLRWVDDSLSPHDHSWARKVLALQHSVMVEQRHTVLQDFAREYRIVDGHLQFVGYSLFSSEGGVYRSNILLPDDAIRQRIISLSDQDLLLQVESAVDQWLSSHVAPHYQGPLGVDLFVDDKGLIHVGEVNIRHTMGLVAHQHLLSHPELAGSLWHPSLT